MKNSMNSREQVLRAFHRMPGKPDRHPVQFDLCRSLTDHFSKALCIPADFSLSYYEDLAYRTSANAILTAMGSDCVIVGGTVCEGFVPKPVSGDISENEFGMHMKPTPLYMEVVRCPLAEATTVEDIGKYAFPDACAPGRFVKAKHDIAQYKSDYFVIGDCELSIFELAGI